MAPQQPSFPIEAQSQVQFGRDICGNLPAAESREWLVTNGIGGFASGTIATGMTRRYHGLLIAALQPPVGRNQLVAALDETVRHGVATYALATHRWASGAVDPQGFLYLESFRLEGTTPVWTYALADALLEKRVWMVQGENTAFIHYTLSRSSGPIEIDAKALVNYRDFHSLTHAGDWHMKIAPVDHGVMILPFDGARFRLEGTTPVWTYALADALLEKRVWMVQGENTTFIHYTLARSSGPIEIDAKALVNYRDFHSLTHAAATGT